MEEILASIRRIIAEDEAGRARTGTEAPPRPTDSPSRNARQRASMPEPSSHSRTPQPAESGDMVLDLTNMVAADGSVVTIAPTFPQNGRAAPPPPAFAPAPAPSQETAPYTGFSRRAAPPPGPGAEPRSHSFTPPPLPPMPQPPSQPMGFSTDGPSYGVRPPEPPPMAQMAPMPAALSEDSPSRRVFKRRHQAGTAFAELAQTGFAPQPQQHPDSAGQFGKVSVGAVATELDMSPPPMTVSHPHSGPAAAQPFPEPDPYVPPSYTPPMQAPAMHAPAMAPAAPAMPSEEQMHAAIVASAEPIIRSWLDANLGSMIAQQMSTLVQQRVEEVIASSLPQAVDQRIHQNVEQNLGPYIEDRVGAHVDARLAAAVEEKVTAAVKQQVASAVNQQIAQAVTQQVAAAVTQQIQGQQQNVTRLVDDRVKSEIRGLFSRLAGN